MNNSPISTTTRTPNLARNMAIDLLVQLPDVQDSLFKATSLTARDLANAVLVSRLWYQAVTPFLWRNFFVAKGNYNRWPRLKEGFIANSKWIQAIYLDSPKVLSLLEEVWEGRDCSGSNIPDQKQSSLQELSVYITEENTRCVESMARLLWDKTILLTLKEFRCCSVFGNWSLIPEMATGFVQYPPRLTSLKLERADIRDEDCLSAILNHLATTLVHLTLSECMFSRNTFTKADQPLLQLTSFFWKDTPFYHESFVFAVQVFQDFMRVAVNLIDFALSTQHHQLALALPVWLPKSQDSGSLGSLRRLKVEGLDGAELQDQDAVELLNELPSTLESLELKGVFFHRLSDFALRCRLGTLINLTTIKLANGSGVSTKTWQTILTSCERLIELDGGSDSVMDVTWMTKQTNGYGGTEGDHSHRWVCHGLETLVMKFKVGRPSSFSPWQESPSPALGGGSIEDISAQAHGSTDSITQIHRQLEILFEQLSQLSGLKTLELIFTECSTASNASIMEDDYWLEDVTTRGNGHWDQNVNSIHNKDDQADQKDFLPIWQSLIPCWQMRHVHVGFEGFPSAFWLGSDGSSYGGEKLEGHGREMWKHLCKIHVYTGIMAITISQ